MSNPWAELATRCIAISSLLAVFVVLFGCATACHAATHSITQDMSQIRHRSKSHLSPSSSLLRFKQIPKRRF
ncbi:hypothetical protein F5144DRAFT_564929 [Chaetomium tenue]|uniref:Uncharacterized protein n=1 Tax=Chaetomium tenue TaxID=1854479 RepID=A0ACB7PN54_9PEZI|nr:hypothetical protein F5144DRAFT_564929 [Chaetomium globosum]